MFKTTRRKIIVLIMAVLILLFLGALGVIYGSSYYEVSARNREMLARYADLYSLEHQPGQELPSDSGEGPPPEHRPSDEVHAFQVSTFYSVALSQEGEVLETDNDGMSVYSDEELAETAKEIAGGVKAEGIKERLIYLREEKDGYTLVAFMDNTIIQESITTLFRYTLLFGSVLIVLLFFLSVYMAGRIVRPLENIYAKQKRFITDAGHELKTPVSAINVNAEILARENGDSQWLANIRYENRRMGELVTQLLDLARAENVKPRREDIDFSRLVLEELLPFESVAFEKGIELRGDILEHIFIVGDGGQLKQLVSILLDNAVDHCSGGKKVSVVLKKENGQALLTVINDGREIPKKEQSEIFERFYRIDPARSGEEGHYGLGLSIAKEIAAGHRSRIHVRCYEGKVEFSVRFSLKK